MKILINLFIKKIVAETLTYGKFVLYFLQTKCFYKYKIKWFWLYKKLRKVETGNIESLSEYFQPNSPNEWFIMPPH